MLQTKKNSSKFSLVGKIEQVFFVVKKVLKFCQQLLSDLLKTVTNRFSENAPVQNSRQSALLCKVAD